jgi:tetratricopeptide (TPR) repeat protein
VTTEKTNIKIKERALALMTSQNWEEALKKWEVWFGETKNSHADANALHDRAICKFHLSDKVSAIKDLDAAAELQPEYGYRYSSRAWMKQANGDTDGAISDYKIAIELEPEDAVNQNNLGILEESKGYKNQADKRYIIADGAKEKKVEKTEPHDNKTIFSQIKSVCLSKESRKEWLKFMLNGFTLKD